MVDIRHAEPRDRPEWTRLRLALWPDEGEAAHSAAAERFLLEPRGLGSMPEAVLVAESPARAGLIGFAEVSRLPYAEGCETRPVGFLEGWYVVPDCRRQRVGRALIAAAEAWARGLGCEEFASDAVADNEGGTAAHRALGFEEVVIRCFRKSL
jgi:aminoglycoside 6'-N-acetyltransferase I